MIIAVLGATGGTGIRLVKEALAAQHNVIAIVRNPDKLNEIKDDRLKVMKSDIFSEEELSAHFRGVDAVVSCLGFQRKSVVTGYSDSIKPIVSAMRIANIQRLVVMTAYYTDVSSAESQGFFLRWVLIPLLRPKLVNMREMEKYIETNCSDINYTIVRAPGLTNSASSGKVVKNEIDGYFIKNGPSRMPRVDVAKYMLDSFPKSELFKKAAAIGI